MRKLLALVSIVVVLSHSRVARNNSPVPSP